MLKESYYLLFIYLLSKNILYVHFQYENLINTLKWKETKNKNCDVINCSKQTLPMGTKWFLFYFFKYIWDQVC